MATTSGEAACGHSVWPHVPVATRHDTYTIVLHSLALPLSTKVVVGDGGGFAREWSGGELLSAVFAVSDDKK